MASVAFVINPARTGSSGSLQRRCRAAARAGGWEPLLLETEGPGAGLAEARRAVLAGARLIVAAGGDGTVRACAQAVAGTGVPLGIVPLGTANIAARALGLPTNLGGALAVALGGSERAIDVGEAEGLSFLGMAGIGLDAAVVRATPALLKANLGWTGYALAGLVQLPGRASPFSVRLDAGPELRRQARSVVVGNAGLLPGGFSLLPDARLDDGVLDVGVLAPEHLTEWLRVGWRVLTRSAASDPLLERHRARRVEIHAGATLPRQVDGEVIAPGASLTVTLREKSLLARVPPVRRARGWPD